MANTFREIANGTTAANKKGPPTEPSLKYNLDLGKINEDYNLGLSLAEKLMASRVTTVWVALRDWLNSPNDHSTEMLTRMISEARSSVAVVQRLLKKVQADLERYEGNIIPHGLYSRSKAKILSSCTKYLEMTTVVLQTLIELEQIYTCGEPVNKTLTLEQSRKIHEAFILWRKTFHP